MFAVKGLPALSGSVRTAQVRWKGESEGACGGRAAPARIRIRAHSGRQQRDRPACGGRAPAAAFAAGEGVAVYCGGRRRVLLLGGGRAEEQYYLRAHPRLRARVRRRGGLSLVRRHPLRAPARRRADLVLCARLFAAPPFTATGCGRPRGEMRVNFDIAPPPTRTTSLRRAARAAASIFPPPTGRSRRCCPSATRCSSSASGACSGCAARGDERDFEVSDLFSCAPHLRRNRRRRRRKGGVACRGRPARLRRRRASLLRGGGGGALRNRPKRRARRGGGRAVLFAGENLPKAASRCSRRFAADGSGASYLRCAAEGLTQSQRALFVLGGKVVRAPPSAAMRKGARAAYTRAKFTSHSAGARCCARCGCARAARSR